MPQNIEASSAKTSASPQQSIVGLAIVTALQPALTRSEVAVAQLAVQGLSNPQIAGELHISRHTAETHMKHILAKLGISSRVQLAYMVATRLVNAEPLRSETGSV